MHPLRIKENWVFLWQLNNLSALFCREELSKQSEGEPYISRQSSLSFFISKGIILPDYSFVYTFSLKLFLLCFRYLDIYTAFITVDCGHLWVSAQFCPRGFLWKKKVAAAIFTEGHTGNLQSPLEASAVLWSQPSAWHSEVSLCSWVLHFFGMFSFLVTDVICFFPSIMLLA